MPIKPKVGPATTNWDGALVLYRGQLQFYLDYLIPCECAQEILADVDAEVRERFVPDDFKLRFLLRTLVKSVIGHLQHCTHETKSTGTCRSPESSSSAQKMPAQERLVYFMRDILEYPTRDTSLLIGISDVQVEALLLCARKRIDMKVSAPEPETHGAEWTCFQWKFVDLHSHLT